ncbi:hypothetical protein BH20ACT21_BH20ACT21_18930 [soil metagenome]
MSGAGSDYLRGGAGDDEMDAGADKDFVREGPGDDSVRAERAQTKSTTTS